MIAHKFCFVKRYPIIFSYFFEKYQQGMLHRIIPRLQ